MEIRQLEKKSSEELFKLANERVSVPTDYLYLKYFEEVDLLVIRFSENDSSYSKSNLDEDIIYNYDEADNLVSMEILDFLGVFVSVAGF